MPSKSSRESARFRPLSLFVLFTICIALSLVACSSNATTPEDDSEKTGLRGFLTLPFDDSSSDDDDTPSAEDVSPEKGGTPSGEEDDLSKSEDELQASRDTTPPEIAFVEDTLVIQQGEAFDPHENIVSVLDETDGTLKEVSSKPEADGTRADSVAIYGVGWYLLSHNVDTSAPGTYEVSVTASDRYGNEEKRTYSVVVEDSLDDVELSANTTVLEYSDKATDATKLVTCSDADASITASPLDLSSVGTQTVTYTISKGGSSRTIDVDFEVRDTKVPSISLKATELTINEGDAFDPYANITSVTDPVDGELARVDAEPSDNEPGWYTITGSYDAGVAGIYYLTTVACDQNGNRATKAFTLEVKEAAAPEPEEAAPVEVDNAKDYVLNTNTRKFHKPTCRHVKSIADHNRQDVHMDRNEILDMGYAPCKVCNP